MAIYVREDFNCKLVDVSPGAFDGNPEHILLEICDRQMPAVLVGVIYRAPRLNLPWNFWSIIARLSPFYANIVIAGDLNINLVNRATPDSRHLVQQAEQLGLSIVPFNPTHHKLTSHT